MNRGADLDYAGDMSQQRHVAGGSLRDAPTAARTSLPAAKPAGALSVVLFTGRPGGATRAFPIDRPLTIGRSDECSIWLQDDAVSRVHAELAPHKSGLAITDRGSRNETYVDGRRIEKGTAPVGSVVRVGDSLLRVVVLTEPWRSATVDGPLVGGLAFEPIRRTISLIGPTNLPVAVFGETGTGKEIAARMLHAASGRGGPFIAVNCAAIPQSLIESELFGHARGAFTGATQARRGMFSAASGGTLFLDEVGDLPADAQAKLLRVLEDGLVRPVGGDAEHHADVRVISATNRDLHHAVQIGAFRSDLLARLSMVELRMPALRHHPEDLPALAEYLMRRAGQSPVPIGADALEALALHDWPQNTRELDRVLRTIALSRPTQIEFSDLPESMQQRLRSARGAVADRAAGGASDGGSDEDLRTKVERSLAAHHGNVRQASASCGIARGHFYRLLERWELDPKAYRAGGTKVARGRGE